MIAPTGPAPAYRVRAPSLRKGSTTTLLLDSGPVAAACLAWLPARPTRTPAHPTRPVRPAHPASPPRLPAPSPRLVSHPTHPARPPCHSLVKSSLCSEPSAVFYAPEGTVIDSNRSTIRAADALLTTVVSLSLIVLTSDFDDGRSAVGDVCDMLTDTMCTASSPEDPPGYNECFSARTLRETLCFACPNMNNVGLFGESLRLVADATGSNISFATFRLQERPLPWSPNDIAWFALWLVPVWMLLLIPVALLARWLLRPRDTVRRELAAALDRVEEEDVRRRFAEPDVRPPVCVGVCACAWTIVCVCALGHVCFCASPRLCRCARSPAT